MFYPDNETRQLLVREHQAELRRLAQRPPRDSAGDLLPTVMTSRRAPMRRALNWLRRRRRAHRRTAHAS